MPNLVQGGPLKSDDIADMRVRLSYILMECDSLRNYIIV